MSSVLGVWRSISISELAVSVVNPPPRSRRPGLVFLGAITVGRGSVVVNFTVVTLAALVIHVRRVRVY